MMHLLSRNVVSQVALRSLSSRVVQRSSVSRVGHQSFPNPLLSVASFHVSAVVRSNDAPVGRPRRRRRGGYSPSPQEDSSSSLQDQGEDERAKIGRSSFAKVDDTQRFSVAAQELLSRLKKGLVPMERANDFFVVTSTPHGLKIELPPGEGMYTLEVDNDAKCLYFQSAISGGFTYVLTRTGRWVSADDGHIFEGILVRDLISKYNGVPDL